MTTEDEQRHRFLTKEQSRVIVEMERVTRILDLGEGRVSVYYRTQLGVIRLILGPRGEKLDRMRFRE